MPVVSIKDNSRSSLYDKSFCNGDAVKAFTDLQGIANYPIKELVKSNPKLLVFPHCLNDVRDKFDDSPICKLCGSVDSISKAEIESGNVMGFVSRNDTELRIHSRFAKSDNQDYFLHYMLQKVFSINVMDFKVGKDDESVFDFLLYLFPYMLTRAVSQGIYKEYQTHEYNDDRVRGPIDVSRHIRYNIPFNGKIAYRTREFCFDNRITQLVRHTIEYIASSKQAAILTRNNEVKDCISKIREATPSYNLRSRYDIIAQNRVPVRNPYFMEYNKLQALCINILLHKKLKFGQNKNEIYGVLFDGAWLWEEYLWTILKKKGFEHPENKTGLGRLHLFGKPQKYPRYPDFYSKELILDAKYKRLAYNDDEEKLNRCISRDDFHQIISYLYITQKKNGGFIFPDAEHALGDTCRHTIGELNGYGGEISLYGFPVPKEKDYSDYKSFCAAMENAEEKIISEVKGVWFK